MTEEELTKIALERQKDFLPEDKSIQVNWDKIKVVLIEEYPKTWYGILKILMFIQLNILENKNKWKIYSNAYNAVNRMDNDINKIYSLMEQSIKR